MERYRFHSDGALFYVTFSVVDWLPIFVSEAACKIVTESLNFCHCQKGLRINAYVIMPTHLHAILFHANFQAKALEQVVTDFRKFTGRRLADFCAQHMPACFQSVLGSARAATVSGVSGNRHAIRCKSRRRASGRRRSTTCTTILCARGW
jgi:putative transposase